MPKSVQTFFHCAALILLSLTIPLTARAEVVPGNACATNNQVIHSGGPENSGNAYWMVCQGGTWRQIFSVDNTGMASTNTPTAAAHVATKAYVDAIGGGAQYQVFTSNGTFTVPAGKTVVKVTLVGGGGGGGGRGSGNPGGGGGASGTIFQSVAFPVTPGANIGVTVGAAGSGGAVTVDGADGGNSSFSAIIARGGRGGWADGSGGSTAGGVWPGSPSYFIGGTGYLGTNSSIYGLEPGYDPSGVTGAGGQGGAPAYEGTRGGGSTGGTGGTSSGGGGGGGGGGNIYGVGGNGGNANGGNGTAATGYGGGGGGGAGGGAGGTGGNGAPGLVIVEW